MSQVTEDDIENFYSHKSRPVILAAKESHKRMLRKQRAPWYKLLEEGSDSDGELYEEELDELGNNIRNMNFNQDTDNYYVGASEASVKYNIGHSLGLSETSTLQLHKGIGKKERNQLKTNYLKKSLAKMMITNPAESKTWNDELFDNEENKRSLRLLENSVKKNSQFKKQ